jgi:hypothetical protein
MKALRSALRWHREGAKNIVAASDYAFAIEHWLIGGLLFTLGIISICYRSRHSYRTGGPGRRASHQ